MRVCKETAYSAVDQKAEYISDSMARPLGHMTQEAAQPQCGRERCREEPWFLSMQCVIKLFSLIPGG